MKIKMIQSIGTEKLTRQEQMLQFLPDDGTEEKVLNIYPQMTFQKMEGFGGALTDAAGAVFTKMSKEQQDKMLAMYFSDAQMNYQRVRIHMDSCDFSTRLYSAFKEDDEDIERFDFSYTEENIIPLLEAASKVAKKPLKLMLSPWSPPAFMKTNGSRKNGGGLKPEYRKRWAECICRYIEEFVKRGYEVERISVQNEPKAVQLWDSCVYTAQQEKEFLRDFLYPALREHHLEYIEVFIWDHNKERVFERALEIIDDKTDAMVDGVAFHWYSGDHFEALDLVHQKFPDKKMILSESCLEYNKFDSSAQAVNAGRLAHDMIGNLNHGLTGFYDWNVLLNVEGGPNHVGNFCDAPFLFDEKKKKLIQRMTADYYWHFAHFIKPDAVRLGYSRYSDEIDMTVWKNPDGTMAVILLNRSEDLKECVIRLAGKMISYQLQAHSIASGLIENT